MARVFKVKRGRFHSHVQTLWCDGVGCGSCCCCRWCCDWVPVFLLQMLYFMQNNINNNNNQNNNISCHAGEKDMVFYLLNTVSTLRMKSTACYVLAWLGTAGSCLHWMHFELAEEAGRGRRGEGFASYNDALPRSGRIDRSDPTGRPI